MREKPPSPAAIKEIRQKFGLSVREFEEALGYSTDGRITQALECGMRGGRPFEMTGPAQPALGYLGAIKNAYEMLNGGDPEMARAALCFALPGSMR